MKKPLAIIFNDIHLKPENEEAVLESIIHMLKYAKVNKIKNLIFAGDLFHSRSFQRESTLQACDKILGLCHMANCTLYLFPGNHDKTIYEGYDSFLDPFRFYPSVIFNKEAVDIEIDGKKITLLPFFSDNMLIPMIEDHEGGDVLISHFEMSGSTNLGRVSEKSSITRTMLKKWKKTYLGHYHNTHEITKNIIHLPSLRQNDFGEDSNKGFSVLYDDLSYEIIKGVFRGFNKVIIDINKTSTEELNLLIKAHKNNPDTVRFEFTGDESKLKAIDKSMFQDTGIDIKIKYDLTYEIENKVAPRLIKKYDIDQIKDKFKIFCKDKGYDEEEGLIHLTNFLNERDG